MTNLTGSPLMQMAWHDHFDPVERYKSNFRKLKSLEFITVMRDGKETMVQIKQTFTINVSEGTRVCPLVARLNPEWRCKEWDEDRTETYNFFGFKPDESKEQLTTSTFNMDEKGEYFTKISGQHN